jgi:hypothetical protein
MAVLPHPGVMMALGSARICRLWQPDYAFRGALRQAATDVLGDDRGPLGGRGG